MRVQSADRSLTRRAVLAGLAAGVAGAGLAGCDLGNGDEAVGPPEPDALLPFLTRTIALRDRYTAAVAAVPDLKDRLTPLHEAHRDHVIALAREMGLPEADPLASAPAATAAAGAPPSGTPQETGAPTSAAEALTRLTAAEKAARDDAVTVCVAAPWYRAELLGSIAACRASHLEVLK